MMFRDMSSAFVVVEQNIRFYENTIKETYHSPSCATHDLNLIAHLRSHDFYFLSKLRQNLCSISKLPKMFH